ncbi:GLABROUS1 enhancer-binding protein-like [Forsythia ovata]|uniref:GLABROUS1 enhancer-binding protein-like n=1 Tax=Forsythia ovata TaxID=205694 RepID=A0ABD1WR15_9LAMI
MKLLSLFSIGAHFKYPKIDYLKILISYSMPAMGITVCIYPSSSNLRRYRLWKDGRYKAKKKGARLDFANPHNSTIFDLSHKLWGNYGCEKKHVENSIKKSRKRGRVQIEYKKKKQKEIIDDEVQVDMELRYPLVNQCFDMNIGGFSASSEMLKKNWTLMGSYDAQYFEEEWSKIRIEEAELHHKMLSLVTKMAGVVLESLED